MLPLNRERTELAKIYDPRLQLHERGPVLGKLEILAVQKKLRLQPGVRFHRGVDEEDQRQGEGRAARRRLSAYLRHELPLAPQHLK